MSLCVLIPAYNEARSIGALIDEVKKWIGTEDACVIIDDCSTDETSRIVQTKDVTLLRQDRRQGKGEALRRGFQYVLKKTYDLVVMMDGDGQHDPREIPRFLKRVKEGPFDLVVGDRMQDARRMPWVRRLTNRVLSALISVRAGVRIPDSQCGYRIIRRHVIKQLHFLSSKYEIDSEILIRTAHAGFRIGTLPICAIYGKEESNIRPLRDGVRFFRFYLKDLLHF